MWTTFDAVGERSKSAGEGHNECRQYGHHWAYKTRLGKEESLLWKEGPGQGKLCTRPMERWLCWRLRMSGKIYWLEQEQSKVELGVSKGIPYDELEKFWGFLVHMVRTYPSLNPYLKGIHLTLCSWMPGQDVDGWKP